MIWRWLLALWLVAASGPPAVVHVASVDRGHAELAPEPTLAHLTAAPIRAPRVAPPTLAWLAAPIRRESAGVQRTADRVATVVREIRSTAVTTAAASSRGPPRAA